MKIKRVIRWSAGVLFLAFLVLGLTAYVRSTNDCYSSEPTTPSNPMKAIVFCDYGAPSVLKLQDVEKPVPGDDELLVRVHAASVNPVDWHFMRGTPYLGRIAMGLRRPKDTRLGVDFAGTVEAVGRNVTQFKPGDEVFGGKMGSLAEYVTTTTRRMTLKPANVTFEQAAGVAVAGTTALQGLRNQGNIQPGQKVLINGSSGGVGTFAVQLAKSFGAEVTAVCSTRNVELVRSIGADHVIDYTKENFTKGAQQYDLIIDNVGNHSLSAVRRVLNPDGTYVMIGGSSGKFVDPLPRALRAIMLSWFVSQDMRFFLTKSNQQDLTTLSELMQAGRVTPVIDRVYPLSETSAAIAYLETGRARGKVVVVMHDPTVDHD